MHVGTNCVCHILQGENDNYLGIQYLQANMTAELIRLQCRISWETSGNSLLDKAALPVYSSCTQLGGLPYLFVSLFMGGVKNV